LLDRFDLRVAVPRVEADELLGPPGESSVAVRVRVAAARLRQVERGALNRSLSRDDLDRLPWDADSERLLRAAIDRLGLTGRGWDRVRRVARTIADLEGTGIVAGDHVAEAMTLRGAA
jgi:magnesium chelatase family protein